MAFKAYQEDAHLVIFQDADGSQCHQRYPSLSAARKAAQGSVKANGGLADIYKGRKLVEGYTAEAVS